MKLDDFFEQIDKWEYIPGDLIVRIEYKYKWEKKFLKSNEILIYIGDRNEWMWLHDWDEDFDIVNVLGFIPVDDISLFSMNRPEAEVRR